MVSIPAFSAAWPITVSIRDGLSFYEPYGWLLDKAHQLNIANHDLFTNFTNRHYGFKDKVVAMEFKLRFS